jgi:hypothetical protein
MYVYCFYSAISKSPKHLSNCLKIIETSVVLIVFNGVICDVRTYTVTVSFCRSTWIRHQKCFIRSMTLRTLHFFGSPLLVLKSTQLQDKIQFRYNHTPAPQRGRGVYCFTSVRLSVLLSVQDIFRHIFLSNCWWQKSDIWSQASYWYTILWVAF